MRAICSHLWSDSMYLSILLTDACRMSVLLDQRFTKKGPLPSLKILHLHSVALSDEDSMQKLIDGCPIIEKLDIEIVACLLNWIRRYLKRLNGDSKCCLGSKDE